MVISFLLAKMSRQKTYVFVSAAIIALISFFSVGLPFHESGVSSYPPPKYTSGIVIRHPLPLSFPFYSVINCELPPPSYPQAAHVSVEYYQIKFLTTQFPQSVVGTIVYQNFTWTEPPIIFFAVDWGDYFLYYTFFFSFNLVGAIIGYWTSRSTLPTKLKHGAESANELVDTTLKRISLSYLTAFYVFLTAVDIAQTVLGFPEYEVGIIAKLFIVFFTESAWLYFPFRIILTVIIVFLVCRYTTLQVSKKLFVTLSVITFASVIWNLYSLASWSP